MQALVAVVPHAEARAAVLVLADGSATLLRPKPLPALVDAITRRKHYKEAIGVAEDALARIEGAAADGSSISSTKSVTGGEAAAVRELIAATEAKLAAHLLERAGEPEAAMQHYVKTIGCATLRLPTENISSDFAHL
jgi:hypothetical protein